MPGKHFPNAALLGEIDLSGLASTQVFTRAGVGSLTLGASVGRYRTIRHFLNGHGVKDGDDLQSAITSNGTGGATWTVGINSDDRFYVTASGGTVTAFEVQANAAYGFTSATADDSLTATAPGEWVRGRIEDVRLTIDVTGAGDFSIPFADARWCDTPIHQIRERGTIADADDLHSGATLEDLDPIWADDNERVRWGIDEDTGLVWCAYDTGAGGALTFTNDTFREMLGFDTNTPTEATSGSLTYIIGDRPPPSVLALRKPFARVLPMTSKVQGGSISSGGRGAGIVTGTSRGWMVRFEYGSPIHSYPMERHMFRDGGWLDQCPPWAPVDVYSELGDPRRATDDPAQGYSALYTPQDEGRRGRHVCTMTDTIADLRADYGDQAVEFLGEVEIEVTRDPDN